MKGRRTHRGSLVAVGGGEGRLRPNLTCEGEVRAVYVRAPRSRSNAAKLRVGYVCSGCGEVAIDWHEVPVLQPRSARGWHRAAA